MKILNITENRNLDWKIRQINQIHQIGSCSINLTNSKNLTNLLSPLYLNIPDNFREVKGNILTYENYSCPPNGRGIVIASVAPACLQQVDLQQAGMKTGIQSEGQVFTFRRGGLCREHSRHRLKKNPPQVPLLKGEAKQGNSGRD